MKKAQSHTIQKIYNALEKPRNRYFLLVNNWLTVITIISVFAVILETVPQLAHWRGWFITIEFIAVTIFTSEYLLRIYASPLRLKYVFSFFGIIDLLAILPTFLGLGSLTFLKVARITRVIRVLRTLRLLKVARFSDKKEGSRAVLGLNFEIYLAVFGIALVLLGTMLYLAEEHGNAPTILHGMYWAFQVIIGDRLHPFPDTTIGTVVMVFVRLTSLLFFGLVIGIIGTILRQTLTGSAKDVE